MKSGTYWKLPLVSNKDVDFNILLPFLPFQLKFAPITMLLLKIHKFVFGVIFSCPCSSMYAHPALLTMVLNLEPSRPGQNVPDSPDLPTHLTYPPTCPTHPPNLPMSPIHRGNLLEPTDNCTPN